MNHLLLSLHLAPHLLLYLLMLLWRDCRFNLLLLLLLLNKLTGYMCIC